VSEDISPLFWSEEVFNGAKIRAYAKKEGVNPVDLEIQIWVYDTLHVLKKFSNLDLFFKGGTCVQSLLPVGVQRFSVDLDFNIETEYRTPEFILSNFHRLNDKLKDEDLLAPASETRYKTKSSDNLIYGRFYPKEYDPISGTVSLYRPVMSKVVSRNREFAYRDDLIKRETVRGIFNHILVQVNIKHHPPALEWVLRDIELKIRRYPDYKKELQFKCLSPGDLFADKVIAYRNRRAFKDLYDLGMMVKVIADSDIAICKQKINHVFGDNEMIREVVEAIRRSRNNKEYLRFLHGLPREVAPLIRDRMFYTELIDIIERI
jgi:predicted nucleotidyltransferase component of viral defense system